MTSGFIRHSSDSIKVRQAHLWKNQSPTGSHLCVFTEERHHKPVSLNGSNVTSCRGQQNTKAGCWSAPNTRTCSRRDGGMECGRPGAVLCSSEYSVLQLKKLYGAASSISNTNQPTFLVIMQLNSPCGGGTWLWCERVFWPGGSRAGTESSTVSVHVLRHLISANCSGKHWVLLKLSHLRS